MTNPESGSRASDPCPSEDQARALICYFDGSDRCVFVNRAWQSWLEVDPVGRSLKELLSGESYRVVGPGIERLRAGETVRHEAALRGLGGVEQRFDLTLIPDFGGTDRLRGYHALLLGAEGLAGGHGVAEEPLTRAAAATAPERIERNVPGRLPDELLARANAADDIETVMAEALRTLAEHHDWQIGHAYCIDEQDPAKLCLVAVYRESDVFGPMTEATMRGVSVAQDFPGNVLRRGRALWCESSEALLAEGRGRVAGQLNLTEASGFPIWSRNRIAYVLEFLGRPSGGVSEGARLATESALVRLESVVRRKLKLGELTRQLDWMRSALDAVADALLVVRPDGLVENASVAADRLFESDPRELAGQHISSLLRGLPAELSMSQLVDAARGESGVSCTALIGDGSEIPLHVSIAPGREEERYVFVLRDLRAFEVAQKQALQNERLAAVGEMVAALAHESRNALQRMQSCLTLLTVRSDGDAEIGSLIDDMQDAQDQLHRLYEDIRNYAAPLELDRQAVDLEQVVDSTWQDLYLLWAPKALKWSMDAEPGLPKCMADPARLEQVFRNVLDNAIHHSPRESAVVCRIREGRLDRRAAMQLCVEDSGPGLTDEELSKAFDLLYTKSEGGSGMGLTIAKRIVERHAGTIRIENGRRGALVTITLPVDG